MSDNNSILLTVIIFTYNQKDSIAKAVDSVLEQETTYPYEIWLCDDCSTDGTTSICIDYAQRFPDKIKLFTQPVNTYSSSANIAHFEIALKKVNTKYLSILEGDDAWCDSKKIQIALDFLENNPQYITFAHDTLFNDMVNGTKKSLVHEVYKTEIQNPVTFDNILYLHTSSRIHRNVVRFSEGRDAYVDLFLFYTFLNEGPLYYYDKIMSIYNITGKGLWSNLSETDVKKALDIQQYKINKFLDFNHDSFFTSRIGEPQTLELLKRICGRNLGWELWYILISRDVGIFEKDGRLADFTDSLQWMDFDGITNQLKIISNFQTELQNSQQEASGLRSELQKSQQEVSQLHSTLSKTPFALEDPTIEKAEVSIRVLDEYYRSQKLSDEVLLFENISKINAHLVAVSLCLRNGLNRKALSHLIRIGRMDPAILFSTQTLKIISNGLIYQLRRK